MKLLGCYIEGYGKIKRREYSFLEGITAFCEENGEGKTTLASFIKAMFYGLKGYRKGSVEFCDREHFYPFDGGLFGGNLTFEMGGEVYKIERFFGDKSELSDSVKVYKNGTETQELGEEIGKAVFGVDRESFERTLFLESGDIEMKSTSGIQAMLNRFLDGAEGDEDVDGAKNALEKAAKVYKKSRAGSDKVSVLSARINTLTAEIDNAASIKGALDGKYAQARAYQEEIAALGEEIVEAQRRNEKLSQFEHYDSLEEGVAKATEAIGKIDAQYAKGLPSLEETESLNAYLVRGKELQTRLEGAALSPKDKEKLGKLEGVFQAGVPTEEELLSVEREIDGLTKAQAERDLLSNRSRTEAEARLRTKFAHGQPTEKEMEAARAAVEKYKQTKAAYDETPALVQPSKSEGSNGKAIACFLAAAICCALGAGLFFWNKIGGAAALILGALLLIAGSALNGKKTAEVTRTGDSPERKRLEALLREAEDCAKAVLLPYGYHSGNGLAFDFATMESDVVAYGELLQRERAQDAALQENQEKITRLEGALTAFFRRFSLSGDTYVKLLADLRLQRSDYADLKARQSSALEDRTRLEEELIETRAKIEGYRVKYGLTDLAVSRILEDIKERDRLTRVLREQSEKAAAFKQEKSLGERSELGKVDLGGLQARLHALQSEKSKLDREIADDERYAEQLEGYQADKAEAEELLKTYKRRHKLLTAAAEWIEIAEGKLRDKYVKPIKDEFLYYAQLIEGALGEKISMSKDFEILFERNGILRSEKHLSAGQRSICALCFRLALIKNMYREELPFLVLDDPFTPLDGGHLEKAAAVLRALSKDMQMVYFTCHESRKI